MHEPTPRVLSHWSQLIENLEASPLEFYEEVEERIERRGIPHTELSRIDYFESGVMSEKREYLRARRERLVFDICGAPFGNGFFISWWLGERQSPYGWLALLGVVLLIALLISLFIDPLGIFLGILFGLISSAFVIGLVGNVATREFPEVDAALAAMPLLGGLYERWVRPNTYYRRDTALMYRDAIHASVQEVIAEMTDSQGVRALSEAEKRPVLREFFGE